MTAAETSQTGAGIGIQFNGNPRSVTFHGCEIHFAGSEVRDALGDAHLRSIECHRGFETALHKAEQLFSCGQIAEASQALIVALEHGDRVERDRQEDHKLLRLRFLEEAVRYYLRFLRFLEEAGRYDLRSECARAAVDNLRRIAENVHPSDQKAQITYLRGRAAKYYEIGKTQGGDKSVLLVAVETFSWLVENNL